MHTSVHSSSIHTSIYTSIQALPPPLEHVSDCFDLFGLDVLVGADLSISLLEVNLQPSMEIKSDVHLRVKESLWREILAVAVAPILAQPPGHGRVRAMDDAVARSGFASVFPPQGGGAERAMREQCVGQNPVE